MRRGERIHQGVTLEQLLFIACASCSQILFVSLDPTLEVGLSPVDLKRVRSIGLIPLLPRHIHIEE